MTKKPTNVWVSAEDLNNDPKFLEAQGEEFANLTIEALGNVDVATNLSSNRRDFLKYLGFGLGAASLAACEIPVKKSLSYSKRPSDIVPGVANYYASSFVNGSDYCAVLVKTRDGRPIKIEGNALSPITKGGTSARAQASVLSLYDTNRLKGATTPTTDGKAKEISWADLDNAVKSAIAADTSVQIFTHTQMSPTLRASMAEFVAKYPNTKVISYDPISSSAQLDANLASFGQRVMPQYHFQKAKVIVGIECDFLGTWVSPVQFARDYAQNRKAHAMSNVLGQMSRHIQLESRMSMTGSNADNRVLVRPSEQGQAVIALYNEVAALTGGSAVSANSYQFAWGKAAKAIKATAKELAAAKGSALVVCGLNDVHIQTLVNGINQMLGAVGSTIDMDNFSYQRQGDDKALVEAMNAPAQAMFFYNCNPAYDAPGLASKFANAIKNAKISVSLNATLDETSKLCKFVAPDHHILESWGDVEPVKGQLSLIQPTIRPLFKTRQAGLSFLTWADSTSVNLQSDTAYYEYLRKNWEANNFPHQSAYATFTAYWDNSVRDGIATGSAPMVGMAQPSANYSEAASKIAAPGPKDAVEVSFYETINVGNGNYASNPWLQELPDPVMKTTWDNFISVPIKWDGNKSFNGFKNLEDGDKVNVNINGKDYSLTVIRQFGQLENTVSIGLGYGRTSAGLCGNGVGVDLYPAIKFDNGSFQYHAKSVNVSAKAGTDPIFACVQMHHTYGITNKKGNETINVDEAALGFQGSLTRRSVFYQATAQDLKHSITELKEKRAEAQHLNSKGIYPGHDEAYKTGHHWGLSVDLSACIGCGACAVACMAENNVPVVGKKEVHRIHEMTWMRIDRYFYGNEETPNTAYMPMMCQHCDNAPCENVCPVNATNHSAEGLNQMTYNRCIGTRYCANNCPYKVRRFNWLDYTAADLFPGNEVNLNEGINEEYYTYMTENLTRMVLNPDVTVRTRGVIEKCSFCVQRIQEGKLSAKAESRPLRDGEIKTACQTSCPTGAIVFGDQNNKDSELVKLWSSDLNYFPLEEVNLATSVGYLMKVTNRSEEFDV